MKIYYKILLIISLFLVAFICSAYTDLDETLVNYWDFEQKGATSYGGDSTLTLNGATLTNDKLLFNNNGHILHFFPTSSDFTFSLVLSNIVTTQSNNIANVSSQYTHNPYCNVVRATGSTGTYTVTWRNNSGTVSSFTFVDSSTTLYLSFSYSRTNSTMAIYANGVNVGNLTSYRMVTPGTRLGRSSVLRASMDDVLVVNQAWTAAQVAEYYSNSNYHNSLLNINAYIDTTLGVMNMGVVKTVPALIGKEIDVESYSYSNYNTLYPFKYYNFTPSYAAHSLFYNYSQTSNTYSIFYVDSVTGEELLPRVDYLVSFGDSVTISSPAISGYTVSQSSQSFVVGAGDIAKYFYYTANSTTDDIAYFYIYYQSSSGETLAPFDVYECPLYNNNASFTVIPTYVNEFYSPRLSSYTFYSPFSESQSFVFYYDLNDPVVNFKNITINCYDHDNNFLSSSVASALISTSSVVSAPILENYVYINSALDRFYTFDSTSVDSVSIYYYYVEPLPLNVIYYAAHVSSSTVIDSRTIYIPFNSTYFVEPPFIPGYLFESYSNQTFRPGHLGDYGYFINNNFDCLDYYYIYDEDFGYKFIKPDSYALVYSISDEVVTNPDMISFFTFLVTTTRNFYDIELDVYGYTFSFWDLFLYSFIVVASIGLLLVFVKKD